MNKRTLTTVTLLFLCLFQVFADDGDGTRKEGGCDIPIVIPKNSVIEEKTVLYYYDNGLLQLKFGKSYENVKICLCGDGITTIANIPHVMKNETLSYNININGGTIVLYSKNSIIYVSESM